MMRSMFASVSGLRAHQTKMDVLGNNIANVNTVGFRGSRVSFSEVYSQTVKGAGAPDPISGRGGTNPIQIGLGIGVGAVDTLTARGSLQRTDSPTDISIEGDGFFIVKAGEGDTYKFTRAGNFGIDKMGNLVTAGGLGVYGWQDYGRKANSDGTYTFDTDKPVEPINIYSDIYNKNKRMIPAKATTEMELAGNLDASYPLYSSGEPAQFSVPMSVYDSLGNEYEFNIEFNKIAISSGNYARWTWSIPDIPNVLGTGATGNGLIDFSLAAANSGEVISGATHVITFNPDDSIGTSNFDVEIDFSKLSMYNADSSVKPTSIDGYSTGSLVTFNIGQDGMITGIYSNGQQQPLGLLGMAAFENAAGLQRVGDYLYIPTTNSGEFKRALKAGAEGVGTLNPGTLEMSNVDLACNINGCKYKVGCITEGYACNELLRNNKGIFNITIVFRCLKINCCRNY